MVRLSNKITCIGLHSVSGYPCDQKGKKADADNIPHSYPEHQARSSVKSEDWGPFESKTRFELAEFLYARSQMSEGNIDELLRIWNESEFGSSPFASHKELFEVIDSMDVGDVPWQTFCVQYHDEDDEDLGVDNEDSDRPQWMLDQHEVFFRDPRLVIHKLLSNPDFCDEMDFSPYREYDENGKREYHNLMGGNWAWQQAVRFNLFAGS